MQHRHLVKVQIDTVEKLVQNSNFVEFKGRFEKFIKVFEQVMG